MHEKPVVYNVRYSVVALVNARSEGEALGKLGRRLSNAGFTLYEPCEDNNAFESDDDDVTADF